MPSFNTLKQLKNHIDIIIKDIAEIEVKTEIITTVKEHIDSDVNNVYIPEDYDRKHYLENSLDGNIHTTALGIELTVEHDENKMNYNSVVSGGKVSGNAVANWIEHGEIYPLWGTENKDGEPYEYLEKRPYMKNSYNELINENIIPHVMKKALKKRKIDSVVL